jgi:chromate transporter
MKERKERQLPPALSLFLNFAKIGLFTFGGGLAMLSLIERTCVDEKQWITHDEMLELTVLAEATPGSIAVNGATYVGYKQKGVWGAVCATVGVVLPSFLVILLIAAFFNDFLAIAWVKNAFRGIKLAVGLLIADAGLRLLKKTPKKALPLSITAGAFAAMLLIDIFAWNFTSLGVLLAAAAVSACAYFVRALSVKRKEAPHDPS